MCLAIALVSCGGNSDTDRARTDEPDSEASPALDREDLPELKFTTFPTTLFLNFWVMQEQGFDEARGFKAVDVNTEGGNTLYTPVIGGQADASYLLPTFAMLLAESGDAVAPGRGPLVPLRGVFSAADPEHVSTLVVAGTPDIEKLEDLRGRTLATHNKASAFFNQLRLSLGSIGLSVDDINVVELPFAQMPDAIRTGNVDAALMDNVQAYSFVSAGRGHIVSPIAGAPPLDEYISLIPAINRGLLERDTELVKALLLGLLDGSAWIEANPDEALDFLMGKLNIPEEQREGILQVAQEEGGFDRFPLEVVIPAIEGTSIEDEYELLRELGLVQSELDLEGIFEGHELVKEVQEQWEEEQ